jgi:FtsH-binding integral membrane protein
MNSAQKTIWWKAAVSAATLLISASVIWYAWANEIKIIDLERVTRTRLIGALNTIPLILIVIISMRFRKKDYDERDAIIEHKSNGVGYLTAFIFLVVAGYCLFLINPRGSTQNIYMVSRGAYLVYLTFFVSLLTSSITALIQYGWRGKGDSDSGPVVEASQGEMS